MEERIECILRIGERLKKHGHTLGTAESLTGGGVGAAITAVPHVSSWFSGGFITYTNEIKNRVLGVPKGILSTYTAVSEETVHCMLDGVTSGLGTEYGIAVSGYAGPDAGDPEHGKPAGTVYIGVCYRNNHKVIRCDFTGDREDIRQQTIDTALSLMLSILE